MRGWKERRRFRHPFLCAREQSGQQAQGELDLKERIVLSEWWDNSFHVPVTFYAYGAREYQLGSLRIKDEEAGRADIWGQELLMQLGLPAYTYIYSGCLLWSGPARPIWTRAGRYAVRQKPEARSC